MSKFNKLYNLVLESLEQYQPPYTAQQMRQNGYDQETIQRLSKDPAHSWRMKTGLQLIHRQPTKTQLMRIWKNWQRMTDDQKIVSDQKCIELFGCTNEELYNYLISQYKTDKLSENNVQYPHTIKEDIQFKKPILFPPEQIEQISKQDRIITTRVSDDYDKFYVGDIVTTSWNKDYKVTNRLQITNIKDHPYYDQLTEQQKLFLSQYNKIAVITLELNSFIVYHASPKKLDILKGYLTVSGDRGWLCTSPFKGVASLFCLDQHELLTQVEAQIGRRILENNFTYGIWNRSNTDKSLNQLPVEAEVGLNIRNFRPIHGVAKGYLYTIDASKYETKNLPDGKEIRLKGDIQYLSRQSITLNYVLKPDEKNIEENGEALLKPVEGQVKENINSVEDLKEFYKTCQYSLIDWRAHKTWMETRGNLGLCDWQKEWKLLTTNQILKYRAGICYDTAIMDHRFLTKWGIRHRLLFARSKRSVSKEYNDDPTHMFNIYYDQNQKCWRWLEGSWKDFKGNDWRQTNPDNLIRNIGRALANDLHQTYLISVITRIPPYGVNMKRFYSYMKREIMNPQYEILPDIIKEDMDLLTLNPAVVANIIDNKVYCCRTWKYDKLEGKYTSQWSGQKGNIFVTPFKGIASCFVISRNRILREFEKLGYRIQDCNFSYDVWNFPNEQLLDVADTVKVTIQRSGIKCDKVISGVATGYLYTIDFNKYKNHCHMFNKNPNSDVEFCIQGDVDYQSVQEITVKWTCNIEG